jgi:hypothetical protein
LQACSPINRQVHRNPPLSLSLSSASTTIKLMVDLPPLVRRLYHSPKNEVSREGECMFPHLWGVGVDFAWLREKILIGMELVKCCITKTPQKIVFFSYWDEEMGLLEMC